MAGTACATPINLRLERLFEAQVARTPSATAVLHQGKELSYEELNRAANQLAHHLISRGVAPGALVPIALRRSPQMLVAILGILKAGAAYVPLDASYPLERIQFMLSDCGARIVLVDGGIPAGLSLGTAEVLNLEERAHAIERESCGKPVVSHGPADLAYVIYTSGSTGRPKGTMLRHPHGIIDWGRNFYAAEEYARVAFTTSVSFDPSILEIFIPLSAGGTVIIKQNALEPFAPNERPSMIFGVPPVISQASKAGAIPDSVVTINVGGEKLRAAVAKEIYRSTRIRALYNMYGPTEASICTTVAFIPPDIREEPPIGRAVGGATLFILDERFQPVPPDTAGELFIGGPGLAQGYFHQPELTSARFLDGLLGGRCGRLYRTGDICSRAAEGHVRFLGRCDDQVKLNGMRIELGEIEHALLRVPGVANAVAMVRRDDTERQRLVAYVETGEPLGAGEIRRALRTWLADSMLPSEFVILPEFPTTPSGKIDRNALPMPSYTAGKVEPFASELEEAIAEIFKDALGCAQCGPHDSFFERGGDSLLSVQTALRLEEMLGYAVPAVLIHQAPSPRALANVLERAEQVETSHVSTLQPGHRPSLFCVSDLFARPFSYLSLARQMAPGRSIVGLAPGPVEAAFVAQSCISVLTAAYLKAVRAMQAHGPYFIAGYSAAGVPAFDLARGLHAQGEDVSLILLDCPRGDKGPSAIALLRWAFGHARDTMQDPNVWTRFRRFYEKRNKALDALVPSRRRLTPAWVPGQKKAFADSFLRAIGSYEYGKFPGRTLLVKCNNRDRIDDLADYDGAMGWKNVLTGSLTQVRVEGNHRTFMREPCVADVAQHVEAFLPQA